MASLFDREQSMPTVVDGSAKQTVAEILTKYTFEPYMVTSGSSKEAAIIWANKFIELNSELPDFTLGRFHRQDRPIDWLVKLYICREKY